MFGWRVRNATLGVAVGMFALLAACSSGDDEANLTSRTWNLAELGPTGAMTVAIGDPTIRFDVGTSTAVGTTGCNSFSGGYSIDGDSLSFGPIAATEIACMDPPGVMEQEGEFLRIMAAVTRYEVTDTELLMESPEGDLVFRS